MSYENLLESAKRYQIAFKNCSTLGEQMMLRRDFTNYVMEGYARGGYLEEKKRVLPTMISKAVRQWIANNETLDPARFPNGYNPDVPPNFPGPNWGLWKPKGFQTPDPLDPGPFWPGWGDGGLGGPDNPMTNPWHWDGDQWRYVDKPYNPGGSPPPGSVDLPEMLKQRYIQILNEKLK